MRFYDCFIARNNFAFNLTAIKELIVVSLRGMKVESIAESFFFLNKILIEQSERDQ